ncbi:MAG: hypothetical protein AAFX87_18155 [Bacteroidota bacterium]
MRLSIILLLVIFCSCGSSKDEELLAESMELHNVALQIGKQVDWQIRQIEEQVNRVEIPSHSVWKDSLDVLKEDFVEWQFSIVEVPGHEHDEGDHHDHDHHDHDHAHNASSDLTPQMIFDIQQELKASAKKLNTRAMSLMESIKAQEETDSGA